ncbi:hypothetical protein AB0D11_40920 [Streptomyces monashensis]|uniref:hypothetical protein n=1 Tax=Streptomyces monashensis TaxID=1678012 RepID=UPI0033C73329
MPTASVQAPTLRTLFDIKGTYLDGPAHDLRFSGLTFTQTTWMQATDGRQRCALVGDAAGYGHPLAALGMTAAILDGECAAHQSEADAYAAEREARSWPPNAWPSLCTAHSPDATTPPCCCAGPRLTCGGMTPWSATALLACWDGTTSAEAVSASASPR